MIDESRWICSSCDVVYAKGEKAVVMIDNLLVHGACQKNLRFCSDACARIKLLRLIPDPDEQAAEER